MDNNQNKGKDPVLREKELDGYRAIAQKIRNRLQQLENATEADKRRWIWELIQNAVDAANGEQVDIEITLAKDFLEFKHNGGCFTPRNVTNLVHQISSKEGTENVGRFGTGFLTTHTLSRKVEVEGVNEDGTEDKYRFYLILNRTGTTERELIEGIEEAWDRYKREQIINPNPPFWTKFKYLEPNLEVAKSTIHDFETFLHLSLAFVSNIQSISVKNEIENIQTIYRFKNREKLNEQAAILTCEVQGVNATKERKVFCISNHEVDIAIPIEEQDGNIFIKSIDHNVPRLFVAYPLIGTEDFYFPFVTNSKEFNPTTERDMLYLKGDTGVALKNKELLLSAVELYKVALNYIAENKWKNTFEVCNHSLPKEKDQFDQKWYKENIIRAIQKHLLTLPIVESEDPDNYLFLNSRDEIHQNAFFPSDSKSENREKIWQFLFDLYPHFCSKYSQIHQWYKIVKNWEDCNLQTIEVSIEDVKNQNNLIELQENLSKETDQTIAWLNNFVAFIEENKPHLLDEYAILPNQQLNGVFKGKMELYEDRDKVPEIFKDILLILGEDWREEYLHIGITKVNMEGKVRWLNNAIQLINAIIERNECYSFTDSSLVKLTNNFKISDAAQEGLRNLKGKIFNRKDQYLTELRKIFTQDLSKVENNLLDNSKDSSIKTAALTLISIANPKSEVKELEYRSQFYQISKDFYKETPEITKISNLPPITWAKADTWILKGIIAEIENLETIDDLSDYLFEDSSANQNSTLQTSQWLNQFFNFLLTYERLELLTDKAVYPNQLGDLCLKSDLFFDSNIPEQLKDILEKLENALLDEEEDVSYGWRDKLLDTRITTFDVKHKLNPKTTKDISEKINALLHDTDYDADIINRNILLELLALSVTPTPQKQRIIWEFARTIYYDNVPEKIVTIPNAEDFDWENCLEWVVNRIVIDISELKSVDILQRQLFGSVDAIDWLGRVVDFLAKDARLKSLLDNEDYPIIPNQNGNLCRKSDLFADDEIPKELKEILSLLNDEWIEELLHKDIYLELPPDRTRGFEHAAEAVDKAFKDYSGSKQKTNFVEAWRTFLNWFKHQKEEEVRGLFDWIYRNKAELSLSIMGDDEQKDEIFKIIQDGNAHLFSKLADGFSKEDLSELAENPKLVRDFINWKSNNGHGNFSSDVSFLQQINEATGKEYVSLEELIAQLQESYKKLGFAVEGESKSGSINFEAIAQANEEARGKVFTFLQENPDYDVSHWTRETNTIIKGVKKKGIDIKLVVKSANNGIIYFDRAQKELQTLTDTFSELWVHNEGKVFLLSLGDVLKEWNVKGMRAYMFDFK